MWDLKDLYNSTRNQIVNRSLVGKQCYLHRDPYRDNYLTPMPDDVIIFIRLHRLHHPLPLHHLQAQQPLQQQRYALLLFCLQC
jgi:hypothetical protein